MMPFVFLALSIGFFHTLLGPDHYLPFIVLSRARGWGLPKTLWITFLCGVGHVLSSVVLGGLGIAFGWAIGDLISIEGQRGEVAGWLLLSFGVLYLIWGVKQGVVGHGHSHHEHSKATPWMLFLIFVFGPCEPLIPVLMYPAVQKDLWTLNVVVFSFALVTIVTMLTVVTGAYYGLGFLRQNVLQRWTHALAGGAITVVAMGMVVFGW
jgi:sulfite exporter TauE/SafE